MTDYISRETAVKIAKKYGLMTGSTIGHHSGIADYIALEISYAPASDVAPVRHGRWLTWGEMFDVEVEIKTPNQKSLGVFCSACMSHSDEPRNYCPECGAKMDEGKVEESCEP